MNYLLSFFMYVLKLFEPLASLVCAITCLLIFLHLYGSNTCIIQDIKTTTLKPTLRNATWKVDKLNSDINRVGMVGACVQGITKYFLLRSIFVLASPWGTMNWKRSLLLPLIVNVHALYSGLIDRLRIINRLVNRLNLLTGYFSRLI